MLVSVCAKDKLLLLDCNTRNIMHEFKENSISYHTHIICNTHRFTLTEETFESEFKECFRVQDKLKSVDSFCDMISATERHWFVQLIKFNQIKTVRYRTGSFKKELLLQNLVCALCIQVPLMLLDGALSSSLQRGLWMLGYCTHTSLYLVWIDFEFFFSLQISFLELNSSSSHSWEIKN